jgi:transposase
MEALIESCCGLDVHQAVVVACVLVGAPGKKPKKELRTFRAFTQDLLELRDWLKEHGCTHVAMESTGVYWKPVYSLLEDAFTLVVGNAHHIRNVPGRKTDAKDAEWIADLLRHGLIASSFVPPKPIRELRDLMRYRRKLIETRSSERNRLSKLLETANIKLSSVATDVFGKSGMAMLEALLAGELSIEEMANLARAGLRRKLPELREALNGRLDEHHRFLLRLQLDRLGALEEDLRRLDGFIDGRLEPYRAEQQALQSIPGVGAHGAAAIIAEIGVDMSVFKSDHHLASWAGVCPGNHESAGKRLSGRTSKGNVHFRTVLVEAAHSATRKRGSYFKAKYYKLKARRGARRALLGIAHKIARVAYQLLARHVPFQDLGEAYLDQRSGQRVTRQLVRRLESMGFLVSLQPHAPA